MAKSASATPSTTSVVVSTKLSTVCVKPPTKLSTGANVVPNKPPNRPVTPPTKPSTASVRLSTTLSTVFVNDLTVKLSDVRPKPPKILVTRSVGSWPETTWFTKSVASGVDSLPESIPCTIPSAKPAERTPAFNWVAKLVANGISILPLLTPATATSTLFSGTPDCARSVLSWSIGSTCLDLLPVNRPNNGVVTKPRMFKIMVIP